MHFLIFSLSILVLIWVVAKIYQRVIDLESDAEQLEQEVHVNREQFYKLSKKVALNTDKLDAYAKDEEQKIHYPVIVKCGQCGVEYDAELEKCPSCNYLNLKKFSK